VRIERRVDFVPYRCILLFVFCMPFISYF